MVNEQNNSENTKSFKKEFYFFGICEFQGFGQSCICSGRDSSVSYHKLFCGGSTMGFWLRTHDSSGRDDHTKHGASTWHLRQLQRYLSILDASNHRITNNGVGNADQWIDGVSVFG